MHDGTASVRQSRGGGSLNPETPSLHRAEAAIAAALPARVATPRLRFAFDDGDWVALVFDESPGRPPPLPWAPAAACRASIAVAELTRTLTPCPMQGLRSAADLLRHDLTAWERLAAAPPPDLDPWERRHLDRLAAAGARMAAPDGPLGGDSLVHLDLRADNILVEPDGRVMFVDWAWACRGPDWMDSVLFALDPWAQGGVDPAELVAPRGVLAKVDPVDVTDLLLGLAGMWAESSRAPAPPRMPTIRAFQRRFHDAALAWGRRRDGGS